MEESLADREAYIKDNNLWHIKYIFHLEQQVVGKQT